MSQRCAPRLRNTRGSRLSQLLRSACLECSSRWLRESRRSWSASSVATLLHAIVPRKMDRAGAPGLFLTALRRCGRLRTPRCRAQLL